MNRIDDKLMLLEKDCIEIAQNDAKILEKEIQQISNEEVNTKINELEAKVSQKFLKERNKIKQEYNKKIFDKKNQNKLKILKLKEEIIKKIKIEIENRLIDFTRKEEYERYLINNIQNALKKTSLTGGYKIYITNNDYIKYADKIKIEYNLEIEKMEDDKKIGGCIIKDLTNNVEIDNTIKNNIEEKINLFNKTF